MVEADSALEQLQQHFSLVTVPASRFQTLKSLFEKLVLASTQLESAKQICRESTFA